MADYPSISDHGTHRRPPDRSTHRHERRRSTGSAVPASIRRACSRRSSTRSVVASSASAPMLTDYVTRQLYLPGTAILVTRFMTEAGVGEVVDFMPIAEGPATDRHRLVRMVRVVRGTMRFVAEIQPRFDYARKAHKIEITSDGAVFVVRRSHAHAPPCGRPDRARRRARRQPSNRLATAYA